MFTTALLATLAAASSVSAHFTVTTPAPRGFDELIQPQGPCGGFNATSPTRSSFGPKSPISIRFADANGNVEVRLGLGANPQAADFSYKIGAVSLTKVGVYDLAFDLSAIPAASAKAPATVQIVATTPDGVLYACSDVMLDLSAGASNSTATPASTTTVAAAAPSGAAVTAPAAPAASASPLARSAAPRPVVAGGLVMTALIALSAVMLF
ncbi:hypothetical protein BC831DRAFT_454500 [Entophlyctis helioformis]|nr:hypothetical protein BC831DRAFT_454500 [Entophlyctis helioformis]